jgi:hypothetical protein
LEQSLPFDLEGIGSFVESGLRKLVKLVKLVNLDESMVKFMWYGHKGIYIKCVSYVAASYENPF